MIRVRLKPWWASCAHGVSSALTTFFVIFEHEERGVQKVKFSRNLLLVFVATAIDFPTVVNAEATASPPAAITATPAVWVVKSPTATVYLMGSVHVLRPNVSWHTPQIARDIAESQELWLEVADPEDQSQTLALIRKYGVSTDGPLTKRLSPEDLAALDKAAQGISANASAAVFDPMRPWVVSLELVAVELVHSGYDLKSGVDVTLRAEFKSAGKPVNGFETVEEQIKVLADVSPEEELTQLHETLKDYDKSKEKIDELVDAWAKADLPAIARSELDEMKSDSPALYNRLVTQRNVGMAKAIKARLDGKGVAFLAVGALHVVGPDSVQSQLESLGVKVERQ